jgi:hypothetical protein
LVATVGAVISQTRASKDNAKKQLRAYLCIAESLVKFTDDGFMEAQLYLQNGGQTPAYKVKTWSNVIIREHPLAQPLRRAPDTLQMGSGIIPSQDKHIIIAQKFGGPNFPDVVMGSIETKGHAFYVYGETVYEDIYGKSDTLEYRLIYGGSPGTRTRLDANGVKCGMLCMDIEGNEERDTYPNGQRPQKQIRTPPDFQGILRENALHYLSIPMNPGDFPRLLLD